MLPRGVAAACSRRSPAATARASIRVTVGDDGELSYDVTPVAKDGAARGAGDGGGGERVGVNPAAGSETLAATGAG